VTAWSPAAIAQMTAVSPKDYIRVIGYPAVKGYKTKAAAAAATIAIPSCRSKFGPIRARLRSQPRRRTRTAGTITPYLP
jgi:hypothetical protein